MVLPRLILKQIFIFTLILLQAISFTIRNAYYCQAHSEADLDFIVNQLLTT